MNTLQSSSNLAVASSKFLLFRVAQLHFALSVDRVQKVINDISVSGSGLSSFGVAHIDDQEITVIDLDRHFLKTTSKTAAIEKGYLILSKIIGETFALWVAQTPTLIDVSLNQIRVLPESYRRGDTLGAASHVMLILHQEENITVFILDVEQLVSTNANPKII